MNVGCCIYGYSAAGGPAIDESSIDAVWWMEVMVVAATVFLLCWGLIAWVRNGGDAPAWSSWAVYLFPLD